VTRDDVPSADPHAPAWGDPPVPDVLAKLLAERYPLAEGERFDVEVLDDAIACTLVAPSHQIRVRIRYESGARSRDPWELLVDALDALVGQLVESGRRHRELPVGPGVEWDGARFTVEVEKDVPELRDLADRWLAGEGTPS
jgi:hypothetical protein